MTSHTTRNKIARLEVALRNAVNVLQLALDQKLFGDVTDDEHDSAGEVESVIEQSRHALGETK